MGVAGAWKTNLPIKTVPTAPIPVQMAYAVPKGKVCTALESKAMLSMVEARKPLPHTYNPTPDAALVFPKPNVSLTFCLGKS